MRCMKMSETLAVHVLLPEALSAFITLRPTPAAMGYDPGRNETSAGMALSPTDVECSNFAPQTSLGLMENRKKSRWRVFAQRPLWA